MANSKKADKPVVKYSKVLVGYDGSDNSRRALGRATLVAAGTGAKLRILVVVNKIAPGFGPYSAYYPEEYVEEMFENAKKTLAQGIDIASATVKDASGLVEEGHPAETILEVAKSEGADLIVIGRRGVSGFERLLLGGVSSGVVSHSACDVLVVK